MSMSVVHMVDLGAAIVAVGGFIYFLIKDRNVKDALKDDIDLLKSTVAWILAAKTMSDEAANEVEKLKDKSEELAQKVEPEEDEVK